MERGGQRYVQIGYFADAMDFRVHWKLLREQATPNVVHGESREGKGSRCWVVLRDGCRPPVHLSLW